MTFKQRREGEAGGHAGIWKSESFSQCKGSKERAGWCVGEEQNKVAGGSKHGGMAGEGVPEVRRTSSSRACRPLYRLREWVLGSRRRAVSRRVV